MPRSTRSLPQKEFQLELGDTLAFASEHELLSVALALGATDVGRLSTAELLLLDGVSPAQDRLAQQVRERIQSGDDPLGDGFCAARRPEHRRQLGAVYTPQAIIEHMLEKVASPPARVIDPGAGSGRFIVQAGKQYPTAELVAVELDPLAALLCRAHLAVSGLAGRARVLVQDYRSLAVAPIAGRTLYIGNPPYVRHHLIPAEWKQWLAAEAARHGISASQLAGLHAYFFLATASKADRGDIGLFITAAEWLDVNYGSLIRELLLNGLGGKRIEVVEPTAAPFPDAMTTAVITEFHVGTKPSAIELVRLQSIPETGDGSPVRVIRRERLETERRWSHLTRPLREHPDGFVELGELCRVHRGQVTGANRAWIEGPHSAGLPDSVYFRAVTRARELIRAGAELRDGSSLRRVIDLPEDLATFDGPELRRVERFLARLKKIGVHEGYVASKRRAWWSVGLRKPAPILATYMARRPPVFVRNRIDARHINIAHGLYPREPLSEPVLARLAEYLNTSVGVFEGRTYAGGLTKFEPREMERLVVPSPALLLENLNESTAPLVRRSA